MQVQFVFADWSSSFKYKFANICEVRLPIGSPTSPSNSSNATSPMSAPSGRPKFVSSQFIITDKTCNKSSSAIFFRKISINTSWSIR